MVPKIAAPPPSAGARPSAPGKGRVTRPQRPQTRDDAGDGSGVENVVGSRPIIDISKTELRRTRRSGVTPIARPGQPQLPGDVSQAIQDARSAAAQQAREAQTAQKQADDEADARQKAQQQAEAARLEAQQKAAEARAHAKALEDAKRQAAAEAKQDAYAKAQQAADAVKRANEEAQARARAEEAARKAAEEAERRIREIEKQAAKLVSDAQARARKQVEEATRAATERQKKLQTELESLRAAASGKSGEEAEQAGQAAAEAEAREAEKRAEEHARAAADDAAKMIKEQLAKLRSTAEKAKQEAEEARAARKQAQKQAEAAKQTAAQAAGESGEPGTAQTAQAAREAMEAAKRAAREAEEATKAAAEHAAKEQAARKQAEVGSKRAAQAEAAAREYEASAEAEGTPPAEAEGAEHIPEAPAVDTSQLTPEQLAAIPQADPVFFQGMVTLVLLIVLIFMTVACIYLGVKLMGDSDDSADYWVADAPDTHADTIASPFTPASSGPHVAGDIPVTAPVIYVVDGGKKMGEFLLYAGEIAAASARSLPSDAKAGVIVTRESGPDVIGGSVLRRASAVAAGVAGELDGLGMGATSPADGVAEALQHNPKTVVLMIRNKDLRGEATALARRVNDTGGKLIIVMMGYEYAAQRDAIKAAEDAGAAVRIYDAREIVEFYQAASLEPTRSTPRSPTATVARTPRR
ncbi:MAG: hypothetical protein GVY16_02615 [Planctomycetes bacterium]|nr:hypothetical protein [Planctomycetota bacterium]